MLKLTSHGLLRYLWSADLSKSFFQLIMSIFIFFQYFFSIDFAQWKSVGYWVTSHFLYSVSLTVS